MKKLFGLLIFAITTKTFAVEYRISKINVSHPNEVDVPALLDLLGLKEGDVFDQEALDRGLIRLALSNNFQIVSAQFNTHTTQLNLDLISHNRIDSIEFISNQKISNQIKESISQEFGISSGDIITADMLADLRNRSMDLLKRRGFKDIDVVPTLQQKEKGTDRDLRLFIQFSDMIGVYRLEFTGFERNDLKVLLEELKTEEVFSPSIKRQRIKEFKRGKITRKFILDYVALDEMKKRFLRRLREKGYYDVHLDFETKPNQGIPTLMFHLNKGPQYNLQFEGNTYFWESDLRENILERSVNLGLPFSMFEAELRISNRYKDAGFKDIKIERLIVDSGNKRKITFFINQGKQFFWDKTIFKGAPMDIEPLLQRAVYSWLEPIKDPTHHIYYRPDEIVSMLGGLVIKIRDLGYLDFKIYSHRFIQRGGSRFFDLELAVQMGQRYQYSEVYLTGLDEKNLQKANKFIKFSQNDYVSPQQISNWVQSIRSLFLNEGYLQVSMSSTEDELMNVDPVHAKVGIGISVNLGPQNIVGKAIIEGNSKTKEQVILRELKSNVLVSGKPFGPDRVQTFQQNLYAFGLFQSVELKPVGGQILQREDIDKNLPEIQEKDVKISVSERPGGSIEFGPGYRTDLGLIGFAELNYRNLGGWNRGVFLRTQLSRKLENSRYQFVEQKHTAVYMEPYLFDWPLRMRSQFEYSKSDDIKYLRDKKISGFNSEELSFALSVDKELFKDFSWTQTVYEHNISKIYDIINAPLNKKNYYRIASVGSALAYDKRDNIFEPRRGFLFLNNIQWAIPEIGGDDDAHYLVWKQKYNFYIPLPNRAVIALSGGYNRLWALSKSRNTPENKRLVLGGRASIRSLSEKYLRFDQEGVLDQQSLEFRSELRQTLFSSWGMAVFYEGGQVDVLRARGTPLEKLSTGFRKAAGMGLRYSTPVGPLSVDFAYNLDQKPGENEYRINLSIGNF